MKSLLFDSWKQWRICFFAGCKNFGWGIARIISCIILGILSVLRFIWRLLVKAVGTYPAAAVIVALMAIIAVWLLTFVRMRSKVVAAEWERDTLSFQLMQLRHNQKTVKEDRIAANGGDSTILNKVAVWQETK